MHTGVLRDFVLTQSHAGPSEGFRGFNDSTGGQDKVGQSALLLLVINYADHTDLEEAGSLSPLGGTTCLHPDNFPMTPP